MLRPLTIRGRILLPDGAIVPGRVEVTGGMLTAVERDGHLAASPSVIVAPGFIDLQINGAFGYDFGADPGAIPAVARLLPSTGVTSFLPTFTSAPLAAYPAYLAAVAAAQLDSGAGARVLGAHLEGPYLNPLRAGAHGVSVLRTCVDPERDGLMHSSLALMTLAPELDGALQTIAALSAAGTAVAIGHSVATFEETLAALDAGARLGTHIFNAMASFQHRKPGLVGALLADRRAAVSLIADGVHMHPSVPVWLTRAKGSAGIALVTDALAPAGMGPGRYYLGRRRVYVGGEGGARLRSGTLAGSILTMVEAVRNMVEWGAATLGEALQMAAATPAGVLGRNDIGRLAPGLCADLVVLDDALQVFQTWVGGRLAFSRTATVGAAISD